MKWSKEPNSGQEAKASSWVSMTCLEIVTLDTTIQVDESR